MWHFSASVNCRPVQKKKRKIRLRLGSWCTYFPRVNCLIISLRHIFDDISIILSRVEYSKKEKLKKRILLKWSLRGSYLAIWSLPLTNVKWHSDPWPTVTSQLIRLFTNFMTLIPSLSFTELWVVSMEHLQRVWLASKERLPFRTPVSVPFLGLACVPIVKSRFL